MVASCVANCYSTMALLIQSLTNPNVYSPAVNPNSDQGSAPLPVYVYFAVIKTLEFNNEGTISIAAILGMSWNDPRLTWSPSNYNNLSEIIIPTNQIWVPSLGLINGVSENLVIMVDADSSASVQCNGNVSVSIARQFDVTCLMNLKHFPFDTENCTLMFQNYDVRISTLGSVFYLVQNTAVTDAYTQDGGVTLVRTKMTSGSYCFTSITACFSSFNISIFYSRSASYFTSSIITPSILLTFMAAVVFFIPVENGVKINVACSVMLAFNFLQQTLDRLLPVTTTTPYCAIAILTELGLGGYGVMCAVVILMVHSLQPSLQPCCTKLINKFKFLICETSQASSLHDATVFDSSLQQQEELEQPLEVLECDQDPLVTLFQQLVELDSERRQLRIRQQEEDSRCERLSRVWKILDSMISLSLLLLYLLGALLAILLYQFSLIDSAR